MKVDFDGNVMTAVTDVQPTSYYSPAKHDGSTEQTTKTFFFYDYVKPVKDMTVVSSKDGLWILDKTEGLKKTKSKRSVLLHSPAA